MAPTKWPRKGNYAAYDSNRLEKALKEVADGNLSLRQAAEKYDIPKSTIYDKYKGRHANKYGRPTVLNARDESDLVAGILTAAKWGYPLTGADIKIIVKRYLDRKGVTEKRFRNNVPGGQWFRSFMQRHKHVLASRLNENIKREHVAVSKSIIEEYFTKLEQSLKDIPPENIINYDETNMSDDPGQQKIIVRRAKHAERIIDSTKSSTSVMFTVSGDGKQETDGAKRPCKKLKWAILF